MMGDMEYLHRYAQAGVFQEIAAAAETQLLDDMVEQFKATMTPLIKAKAKEILGRVQSQINRDVRSYENQIYVKFGDEPNGTYHRVTPED